MTTLIIGSTAIKHHFPDFPREPKDLDSWADSAGCGPEDRFWDDRLWNYFDPEDDRYATPDELYTMKVSHSSWELKNGSWRKHMHDVVWLRQRGCKVIEELYDILIPIWKDRHGAKRVNLNQESGAFFTDAVVRIYDHDSIHDTVAYYSRPLWMNVLKDGQDVAMDMKKVWQLAWHDQVRLFREEVYATALERWVIPSDYECSPALAYQLALRKTITSLTKGKSSRFMIENYEIFRDMDPQFPYVERHLANKHMLVKL